MAVLQNLSKRSISTLIVEDNPDDIFLLEKYLKRIDEFDFEIYEATNLAEGLHLLSKHRIDLCFLNLNLPDSSGGDLLRQIKFSQKNMQVIVTSGVFTNERILGVLQAGADLFLSKEKFGTPKLKEAIQVALPRFESNHSRINFGDEDAFLGQTNFQALVNSSADAMIVIDSNGIIRFSNSEGVKLFQKAPDELIGSEFGSPITLGVSELEIYSKNKRLVHVEMRVVDIAWKGQPAHLATLRDTTERKQMESACRLNENRLNLAMQCGDLAIWDWNLRTGKWWFSDNFVKLLEYKKEDLSDGSILLEELIHPEDIEKNANKLENYLKGETGVYELEYRMKTCSGKWIWILEQGKIVENNFQGRATRFMGLCQDITQRKEYLDEHIKASKLESLGLLAGGIAHDLNNILMALDLNLEMAIDHYQIDDEQKEVLLESRGASKKARELSQRLLAFSVDGHKNLQAIDLNILVREAVDFASRGTTLKPSFEIDSFLPLAEIDVNQFQRVIHNLVFNARDAAPKGGNLTVQLNAVQLQEDEIPNLKKGNYLKLSFADDGCGISKENLSKIFDPYFTTKAKGNGIGLSTCYAILARHQGTILAKSQKEIGTIFTLYLPASKKKKSVSQQAKPEKFLPGYAKILIIDDETVIRKGLARCLAKEGYFVETVDSGEEGIKTYEFHAEQGEPFDLVLLDGIIPGQLCGEEALKTLRQIDPYCKVILFSGYSKQGLSSRWKEVGFSERLQKPCSVNEVIGAIEKVMGRTD